MVTAVLEAADVAYDYAGGGGRDGAVRALDGADLVLGEGELVVVLGPNGSGKSTLVKVLGGLLAPGRGRVLFRGAPLSSLRPRERARRIALVPQGLAALPDVAVHDFVLGGRYAHFGPFRRAATSDRDAVRAALAEADAADLGGRLLAELSGGQRQRALLARALAQEAECLLFDEPTAALDPEHQVRVFARVRELVHRGRSAIAVTHELPLAGLFADRVVLMDAGRVAAVGPPGEVLAREVLAPVYGPNLHYASAPAPDGRARLPLVVPWLSSRG